MSSRIACVVGLFGVSGSVYAQSGNALAVDFTTATLYDVNTATAATSNPRSSMSTLNDIATSPGGVIYATNAAVTTGSSLYTLNPATGAVTLVGPTGLSNNIEGDLAFNAAGTLYGITNAGQLYTLNTATGAATTIGGVPTQVSVDDDSALFFVGANLYAIDTRINNAGQNARLYQINPATGAVTASTTLNVDPPSALAAGEVDPSTGTPYVLAGGTLYTLDLGTSTLNAVGPLTGLTNGSGLTFASTPEPASLTGFAVTALVGLRRRRRA